MTYSHLSKIYRSGLSLATDLYQLTMAYGYWKSGMNNSESFSISFIAKTPSRGTMRLPVGLNLVIDYLQHWKFEEEDLQYLRELQGADGEAMFAPEFIQYLREIEFSCDVDAIPEGSVVFPHEPLLRIRGPLLQAQLIETALLESGKFLYTHCHKGSQNSRGGSRRYGTGNTVYDELKVSTEVSQLAGLPISVAAMPLVMYWLAKPTAFP